jgi:hypothetical protein
MNLKKSSRIYLMGFHPIGDEHIIALEGRSKQVIVPPSRYAKLFKDEIERIVQDLSDMGHIAVSKSPLSSP